MKNIAHLSVIQKSFEDVEDPHHGRADESAAAMAYAKKLDTRHHAINVESKTFAQMLGVFCEYGDQPFGVTSGLGLLVIAREAKNFGIKVLLSGDGADESFGGYSWYKYLPLFDTMRHSPAKNDSSDVSFHNYKMKINERIGCLAKYDAHKRAWAWHYYASEKEKSQLFSAGLTEQASSSLRFFNEYKEKKSWQEEDYIRQDRQFYLPNEMLKKMDRMTMAYSVEGRAPFVAPAVLAHADKLKYDYLVRGDKLKWVLRKAFEDVLPQEIIDRPKHGFNVPIEHWLKTTWGHLVDETFSNDSCLGKSGIISENSLKAAKKMVMDSKRLNGHTIFCFIMLNRWMEKHGA